MTDYYPPAAFSFILRLPGSSGDAGGFAEVSGLTSEVTAADRGEGGENRFIHKLPERAKPSAVVLKRGMLPAQGALMGWLRATLQGDLSQPITPKTLEIALLDASQAPLMLWTLSGAWPLKWRLGSMMGDAQDIAVESVELAYASLSRADAGDAVLPPRALR